MKRLVCLLLLSALLLSACGGAKSPILPSVTEPSSTEPSVTEPIATEPISTEPGVAEPPTLGVHVKTDYSAYQPRVFTPKFTRLQSEPINELRASDSYGKIYPFAGKTNYVSYMDGYVSQNGYYYGMVTQDGCIVADPVYSNVSRLTLPYWVLEKREKSSDDDYDTERLCAIASFDGSVVTDFIYETVYDDENRILAICDYDQSRFELLDENLDVILSSEELWQSEKLAPYSIMYSEGVLLLGYNLGRMSEYGYEEADYYYADETGKIFAGPFLSAHSFDGGVALVQIDEENYTFIDLQGKPMERSFRYARPFYGSDVTVVETDETIEVIDCSGKTILSFPIDECYISTESEYVVVTDSETYAESIYNLDGTLIYDGKAHPRQSLLYGTFLEQSDGSQPYIVNVHTNKRYDIPGEGYSHCNMIWNEAGVLLILVYGEFGEGPQTYRILNSELEELAGDVTDYYSMYGTDHLLVKEKVGYTFFDEHGERVGTIPLSRIRNADAFDDGVLAVSDGFASYLYDENFELIFCYPLTNAMED